MEDGGRPSEGGLQEEPSNRPALRWDKLPGGKRTGKRRGYRNENVAGVAIENCLNDGEWLGDDKLDSTLSK
jgi:hypothetical protein